MRTELARRWYPLVVGGILVAEAALLAANAWRYDWLRGYDAYANDRYAEIVAGEYRLPNDAETGVWHTPPLWFALAGALGRITTAVGLGHPQRPGQLLSAAAGLAVCVLVFLLARELFPGRRVLHVVGLVLAASSPALVRASAMYHPETLAVALATAGVLIAVRAMRARWTPWTAAGAGVVLALAALTRMWALPVLVAVGIAVCLDAWARRRWAPAVVLATVALAVLGPWLAHQQLRHGSALAFNRPPPAGSILRRRPASFYAGLHLLRVVEHPVTPIARNELVPHLYADWWGDWALTWDSPPPPPPAGLLPAGIVAERARQAAVGLLPTVLALAGVIALGLLANARRSARLAVVPLTAVAVATAYAVFAIRYPSTDGDTIKATYLLMALPAGALGAAFVVDVLRRPGRGSSLALAAALVALVAVQLQFLVL